MDPKPVTVYDILIHFHTGQTEYYLHIGDLDRAEGNVQLTMALSIQAEVELIRTAIGDGLDPEISAEVQRLMEQSKLVYKKAVQLLKEENPTLGVLYAKLATAHAIGANVMLKSWKARTKS